MFTSPPITIVVLLNATSAVQKDGAILEDSSVHTWVLLVHLHFVTIRLMILVDGGAHRVVLKVRFDFGGNWHWLVVTVFISCRIADLLRLGTRCGALNLDVRGLVLNFEMLLLLMLLIPYGRGGSQMDTTGAFWSPMVCVNHLAALIILLSYLISIIVFAPTL